MAYFKDSTEHLGALVLHYHFIQLRYHLEETPPKSLMEDLLTWNSQETSETARNFGRGGEGARGREEALPGIYTFSPRYTIRVYVIKLRGNYIFLYLLI